MQEKLKTFNNSDTLCSEFKLGMEVDWESHLASLKPWVPYLSIEDDENCLEDEKG